MRNALRATWQTAAVGLMLTAAATAAFFTSDYLAARERAGRSVNRSLTNADRTLRATALKVDLAELMFARQLRADDFQKFVTNIDPDLPDGAAWLLAKIYPAGAGDQARQDLAASAGTGATISGTPAGAARIAPVFMQSGQTLPLGFDLFGELALAKLDDSPSGNTSVEILAKGSPLARFWPSGALLIARAAPGNGTQGAASAGFLIVRVVSADEFAAILQAQPGQSFSVTDHASGGVLGDADLVARPEFTRSSVLGTPDQLTLAVTPPTLPMGRDWAAVGLLGLLATALAYLWQAGMILRSRSAATSLELQGANSTLEYTRLSEKAFFEGSGTANCVIDADTKRFVRVNDRLVELLGYSREELLARTALDVTHPDDSPGSEALIGRAATAQPDQVQFEKRYRHKDGHDIWCLVTSRRLFSGAGNLLATAIIDISERKTEEQLRNALVRELAHRLRNTVQLTASLARQTAKSARSVADYNRKFQQRLTALRAAQDALFDSNWTAAPLDQIAAEALAPFKSPSVAGPNLKVKMPAILLPPQHAQTIALALHELALNSCAHGALANGGTVAAEGSLGDHDGHHVLNLAWRETSPKAVSAPRRSGFGMRMLESALPEQFNGSATLDWTRSGLHYQAVLPIDELQG